MASAIPVLPLVASINVSPGLISPRSCAYLIMLTAGLSFTEPAGLSPSSLARIRLLVLPGSRCSLTSGVLPTKASMSGILSLDPAVLGTGVFIENRFCQIQERETSTINNQPGIQTLYSSNAVKCLKKSVRASEQAACQYQRIFTAKV